MPKIPAMLPAFEELGSTPGGLTEPPEDKLEGELPGWCQGAPPLPIKFDGGIDTFFTESTSLAALDLFQIVLVDDNLVEDNIAIQSY